MDSRINAASWRNTQVVERPFATNGIGYLQRAAYFAIQRELDADVSVPIQGEDVDDGLAFVDVSDPDTPTFKRLWRLYNTAFQQDERRSLLEHGLIQGDPRFHFAAIRYEGRTAGLIAYWELQEMLFVEHFAVEPEFRSEGIGGRVIETLQYDADRMIVLDVEPEEESSTAVRRVHFYEKHGFRYYRKSVVLPTYWFAKPIASNLMVWAPNHVKLTQRQILNSICRSIYHLTVDGRPTRHTV